MAAPINIPTPGGANADFGAAPGFTQDLGQNLAVPGRSERPRTERIEQIRSLLAMGGEAVAGAIGSQARISAIAKAKMEERRAENARLANWVKTRKAEEDDGQQAAYRRANAERLANVERTQFNILRDPRSENADWVLNEAVIRQGNAEDQNEKDAWNDFILRYQTASRQDVKAQAALASKVANAELISDRRIAAKTAQTAIDDMWNDIQKQPELRDSLIGDGRAINERVNQHVLEMAIEAAPQLFDLKKSDPMYAEKLEQQDILLGQLEARAQQTITDQLTTHFVVTTQKASEATGQDRIDVGAQAFAEGDMSASEYHDLVGDVIRTNFAHVDPRQADMMRERLYRQQFDRLAQLLDQPDPGKALQKMEELMDVADLNTGERQVIREQIISDKFPKAVRTRLTELFQQKAAEMSGITRLNGGDDIVPRDIRSVMLDMVENGTYSDIAGQMLDELGITDTPDKLTPLQANLLGVIMDATADAEKSARSGQQTAVKSVERASRFFGGGILTTEESNDQWQDGALMRLFTGNLKPEDPVFQTMASTYSARTGNPFPWDGGGPIPLNEQTLPVVRDVALQEGQAWGANSMAQIPRSMVNTIESMALYESPERAEVALNFWQGLGSEGQERLGKDLSARAQMALMEGQRLYNLDPVARGFSMTEIANRMRVIDQNASAAALRLAKDQAGLFDVTPDPRFHYDYAKALSTAIGRDVLKDEYGTDLPGFAVDLPGGGFGDALGSKAVQGLASAFGNKSALVPLFAQMAVVQQGNPGISLEQAAVVVTARMREQGYKVISGTLGSQIISDRWNHYPTDVTPEVLTKETLDQTLTETEANRFVERLPNVGPMTVAMAREGVRASEILWSYMDEQAREAGGEVAIPHPDDWAFTPETNGQLFGGLMAQEDGGVPMQVTIPGFGRTQMLLDTDGNPLLITSAKRRVARQTAVDRSTIPDFYLTPHGRRRIGLKPDSAGRMEQLMGLIDGEESTPYAGRNSY